MCDVQPDGDVHGPRDQVSPTLKVTKSAQEHRQSNQFPKLPTSLSRWSPQLALNRRANRADECPLLGHTGKLVLDLSFSGCDPNKT